VDKRTELKLLLQEIFVLEESEFRFDLKNDEVETWDSLGTVSLSVGIEETFGYHFTQEEALGIRGFQDIIDILETNGVSFDG
jgi:acyl carrier protein